MLENIKQDFERVLGLEINPSDIRYFSFNVDAFYVISSALETGIFQYLIEPKNSSELAGILGLNSVIAEKLCNALVSLGYLGKDNNRYYLSDQAKIYLLESSPFYQGHLIKLMKITREQRWSSLTRALKEGPIVAQNTPQIFNELFSLAMAEAAVCGPLQRTVKVLSKMLTFYDARRCLDLGGGHGLYALAFTKINPNLEVVVFDLPHVIDNITNKVVSDSDRIITLSGDFNKDELGDNYDFVFASDVLYKEKTSLSHLLSKIRRCLNQEGLLICKHYHIDDLKTDSSAVLFDLMLSISGTGGVVYSSADFCNLLESAGFYVTRVDDISSPFSPSKIITAQKVGD